MKNFLHEPMDFGWEKPSRLNKRHFKGGGTGSSTQTVQNFSPEEAANRAQVQSQAADLYAKTAGTIAKSPYPGAQVVPLGSDSLTGQNLARATANTMAQQYVPQLNQATQFGLSNVLDPKSNQYLQSTIDSAIRPITQSYTDPNGVLSNIRAESIANGGQGNSTRQGIAEGVAAGRYADAIGSTAGKITSDAYGQGLDTFSKIYGLTPNTMQALTQPAGIYSGIGQQNDTLAQAQENYSADSRNWNLNSQWLPLQNWANIVYGSGPTGSTTTAEGQGSKTSPAMGAIGGALAGWQAGSAMGAGMGPWGAVGGAILGGLFS
jgi:hypothetical protein